MTRRVEAVYEHGVLRPLEPLSLSESQRVNLTITDSPNGQSLLDTGVIERARAEVAGLSAGPSIEEVRTALSSIARSPMTSSLSESKLELSGSLQSSESLRAKFAFRA
jgi:predicted DNA-binding antitoxin AbrB/MazE fold protein